MLVGVGDQQHKQFYDAIKNGGIEFDRKKFVNLCSRHRAAYAAPDTPPEYWDIGFPDTQTQEGGQ